MCLARVALPEGCDAETSSRLRETGLLGFRCGSHSVLLHAAVIVLVIQLLTTIVHPIANDIVFGHLSAVRRFDPRATQNIIPIGTLDSSYNTIFAYIPSQTHSSSTLMAQTPVHHAGIQRRRSQPLTAKAYAVPFSSLIKNTSTASYAEILWHTGDLASFDLDMAAPVGVLSISQAERYAEGPPYAVVTLCP